MTTKPGTKKTLPEHLSKECYRLSTAENWSNQRIADWLKRDHGHSMSRETVRKMLEAMAGAGGEVLPPEAEPELLDDDQQLLNLQCDAYRDARSHARRGDTSAFANAARVHLQVILARKRLRDPAPGGADAQEAVMDVGVSQPLFRLGDHGRA